GTGSEVGEEGGFGAGSDEGCDGGCYGGGHGNCCAGCDGDCFVGVEMLELMEVFVAQMNEVVEPEVEIVLFKVMEFLALEALVISAPLVDYFKEMISFVLQVISL
ncbi:hypothetical protein J6590_101428, partial [Homalodisca vitripennis]